MAVIYWTLGDVLVASNGIGIGGDNAFQGNVRAALNAIQASANGAALLQAILNRIPAKRVGIVPNLNGNGCQAVELKGARTLLADAFGEKDRVNIANDIKIALNRARQDAAWFATQIQQTPAYMIQGAPVTAHSNFPISAVHIQQWLRFEQEYPFPFNDQQAKDLTNIIMIVIHNIMRQVPGVGSASRVYWNPAGTQITLTSGVVSPRPPYIGLAHELVHAYYNSVGGQLAQSEDGNHFSAVLFEYMAVGLGPWLGEPLSENGVRTTVPGGPLPPRPLY